jgi:hypothetical protein
MSEATDTTTAAYKLFHYYIECMIPAAYAYQARHEVEGVPVYQRADMEDDAAREMVPRQHTTVELIEYHKRGASIIIRNPQDAVKMYGWLRDHLSLLRSRVQFSVNIGNIPLQDLEDMDDFATMIYRIARQYEQVDERQGKMNRKLEDMFKHRRMRRKRVEEEELSNQQTPEERPMKEHRSITADISKSAIERGLEFK